MTVSSMTLDDKKSLADRALLRRAGDTAGSARSGARSPPLGSTERPAPGDRDGRLARGRYRVEVLARPDDRAFKPASAMHRDRRQARGGTLPRRAGSPIQHEPFGFITLASTSTQPASGQSGQWPQSRSPPVHRGIDAAQSRDAPAPSGRNPIGRRPVAGAQHAGD